MSNSVPASTPYIVALRMDHQQVAAEKISKELSLTPRVAHSAGDPRRTPKGDVLKGRYSETYWLFRFGEFANPEEGIGVVLRHLMPRSKFTRAFVASGGRIQILIRKHASAVNGLELCPAVLRRMATQRVGLGFEVLV